MHPTTTNHQVILLFLPKASAQIIASRLNAVGYSVEAVHTVAELQFALTSADYRLVITTTPAIETVRDIRPLSIVNLEIFFHPDPSLETPAGGRKEFDTKAFLARINSLSGPRTKRNDAELAPIIPSSPEYKARARPWLRLLTRFREATR